jgi:hypothetical protein
MSKKWMIGLLGVIVTFAGKSAGPTRDSKQQSRPIFSREEVAAYHPKGPSRCFRQICLEYNTTSRFDYKQGVFGKPEVMLQDFSEADPVKYAEFCKRINLDAVLLLAVPEGGYTTYLQTKVGEPFPYLRQHKFDFFGQTIKECHARGISVFGYVIVGWCKKAMIEFPDEFPDRDTSGIPTLNGLWAERVIEYARELLTSYPIDGLRTDILDHNTKCRTPGDKAFYKELYGEDMPERFPSWEREQDFRLKSISRFVQRFHAACKRAKPSVEIWHNWFNEGMVVDLRDAKYVDILYHEFADPFSTLFLRGIYNGQGMISGKLLRNPQRRLCLVLGGRAYDYFPTNKKTAMLDEGFVRWFRRTGGYYGPGQGDRVPESMAWFERELAPFYAMVARVEPYLVGARPVADVGVVFSESSRFRLQGWDRKPLIVPLRALTNHYLNRNRVLEFISSFHLTNRQDLDQFKLLVVPDMSGLREEEHAALVEYTRRGGQVLLTGTATLYNERGKQRGNFALGEAIGLRFEKVVHGHGAAVRASADWKGSELPADVNGLAMVVTRPSAGQTVATFLNDGRERPLVQIHRLSKGRLAYLATNNSTALTAAVIDWLAGQPPLTTSPPEKKAYLTRQIDKKRWILHLMNNGEYSVDIREDFAPLTNAIEQYPATGWSYDLQSTDAGIRIKVRGDAKNRLLVLE